MAAINRSASRGRIADRPADPLDDREFVAAQSRHHVVHADRAAIRVATCCNNLSPTGCPRVSLTALKLSRSR